MRSVVKAMSNFKLPEFFNQCSSIDTIETIGPNIIIKDVLNLD